MYKHDSLNNHESLMHRYSKINFAASEIDINKVDDSSADEGGFRFVLLISRTHDITTFLINVIYH